MPRQAARRSQEEAVQGARRTQEAGQGAGKTLGHSSSFRRAKVGTFLSSIKTVSVHLDIIVQYYSTVQMGELSLAEKLGTCLPSLGQNIFHVVSMIHNRA